MGTNKGHLMKYWTSITFTQKRIIAALLGAGAGYAYYHFIGCASGTCAITSNPYISTIYGAVIGMLLVPARRTPAPADAGKSDAAE